MAEVEGLNRECGQGEQQEQHQEEKERDMGAVKEELKPWEQHAAVISIPRFDYNAPSSLLHYSHPGFLITCPFSKFLSFYLFLGLSPLLWQFDQFSQLRF